MKPDWIATVSESDFPKQAGFAQKFIANHAHMVKRLADMLSNRLTIADNTLGALVTLNIANGVKQRIANPLVTKPRFVVPVYTDNSAFPIGSYSAKPLNSGVANGDFEVVVNYAADLAWQSWTQTSAQAALTTGVETTIVFDTPGTNPIGSTAFTLSGGIVTINEAGLYDVVGQVSFTTNVTGQRAGYILVNNVRVAQVETVATTGSFFTQFTLSDTVQLSAGDNVRVNAIQTSGGALSVNSTGINGCRLTITRRQRTAGPSANVTFWVCGG